MLPANAEVVFRHLRYSENCLMTRHDLRLLGLAPEPQGGVTIAQAEYADGTYHVTIARCRRDENFSRARGRIITCNRMPDA